MTVKDSMSAVHATRGKLPPASECLLSEVAIIARLGRRVLGDRHAIPWTEFEADYGTIRDRIARVVPGFEDTIPYAMDDRYRGIHGARRVVMVNPADIADLGYADGEFVDIVSVWHDGTERARAGVSPGGLSRESRLGGGVLPRDQRSRAAGQRRPRPATR